MLLSSFSSVLKFPARRSFVVFIREMAESMSREKENFVAVSNDSSLFPIVEEELKKRSDIYGNQDEALEKIKKGEDRSCELLLKEKTPITLLVYKEKLNNEDARKNFEIKTLLLLDKTDPGDNLKKTLIHALETAKSKDAENVHLTVSEKEKATYKFLVDNDFKVRETWEDKYVKGVKEFSMWRPVRIRDKDQGDRYRDSRDERKRKHDDYDGYDRHKRRKYEDHKRDEPKKRLVGCTLKKKYIHQIREGLKTVEGRLAVPMFKSWREGQIVRFHYMVPHDDVFVEITKIVHYRTFREMLGTEGVSNCCPDFRSIEKAVDLYHSLPRYREREKQCGVLAFRLKVVEKPL